MSEQRIRSSRRSTPVSGGAPGKTKFQRKREATYQQLIEAGMRLMFENGYTATRAADIARATGHTTGAFYFHFRSKEDFFLHLLRYRERLRSGWQQRVLELDPATTTLEEVIVLTLRDLGVRMHGLVSWTHVMADFRHQTKEIPETRETLGAVYGTWIDEIETFVDALKRQGWVDVERDSHELAVQLFSLVEGHGTQGVIYGSFDEPVLVRGCVRLLS